MLEKDYKFYLCFENAICLEYVTEKKFGRIGHFVVPVVVRRRTHEKQVPSDAFIAADDFCGPKALADYLLFLDKNVTEYLRYFRWRERKIVTSNVWPPKCCGICRKLLSEPPPKSISDIHKWWHTDSGCIPGYGSKLLTDTQMH